LYSETNTILTGDRVGTEEGIKSMAFPDGTGNTTGQAITADEAIKNILKVWYKDGVENLMFRNSPVVKEINKTRVEGKQQNFAAVYSRGGAVAGDFLVAEKKAAENVKNAEFKVTPGQIFSVFSYNAKEVQSSLSKKGAYMKVAGNKAFAATEAFRKTMAAAFYGRGYGEIGVLADAVTFAANTPIDITLTDDAIVKIAPGSALVLKTAVAATTYLVTLEVNSIDGNTVNVTPASAYTGVGGEIVALLGSMDSSGNPYLPVGIDGWLPIVNGRKNGASDTIWTTYIQTPFMGVTRSIATEGLAGNFYDGTATPNEKKSDSIEKLMRKCRRYGSKMDFIIMNDADWLDVANEIQSTNTYFTQTSSAGKRKANVGLNKLSAGFSTNFIDVIYDDPYCPKGKFYVLDKDTVELWAYTNAEALNDGVAGNAAGKAEPDSENDKGKVNDPYKLLLEECITTEPGQATSDGPAVRVTLQLFGSFVVMDPSVNGVGIFSDANTATLLGYK